MYWGPYSNLPSSFPCHFEFLRAHYSGHSRTQECVYDAPASGSPKLPPARPPKFVWPDPCQCTDAFWTSPHNFPDGCFSTNPLPIVRDCRYAFPLVCSATRLHPWSSPVLDRCWSPYHANPTRPTLRSAITRLNDFLHVSRSQSQYVKRRSTHYELQIVEAIVEEERLIIRQT